MPPKQKAKEAKAAAKKAADQTPPKSAPKKVTPPKKADTKASKAKQPDPKPEPPVKKTPAATPAKDLKRSASNVSEKKAGKKDSPKKAASPPKAVSPAKGKGKRDAPAADTKVDATSGIKKTKSDEQIVKVITKGGAAVDALVPNKDTYRVFQDANKSYSATLNQANLDHNNNKFYIVQILMHEATANLFVWNRWGRVGVPGQNALKGPMPKDNAIREYNSKVHDKTVKGDYK